jgi:hypothetical protein
VVSGQITIGIVVAVVFFGIIFGTISDEFELSDIAAIALLPVLVAISAMAIISRSSKILTEIVDTLD